MDIFSSWNSFCDCCHNDVPSPLICDSPKSLQARHMYLELSVTWNHKIAVPTITVFCILVEKLMNHPCPENVVKCEVTNLRRFLIIPSTVTSLFCQLIVIVDESFGWRNIYRALMGFFRLNSTTPVVGIDPEVLVAAASQQPYNPPPVLDQHVVCYNLKFN